MNEWLTLFVGIAFSMGVFALGVVLYPKLKQEEQGYPLESEIEALLLPFIYNAICAAFKVGEWAMDEVGQRLDGLDKKEIADTIYGLLPDWIGPFPVGFIKNQIGRERFEALVQEKYDEFRAFFIGYQGHFEELFQDWQHQNEPVLVKRLKEEPLLVVRGGINELAQLVRGQLVDADYALNWLRDFTSLTEEDIQAFFDEVNAQMKPAAEEA